MPPKGKKGAEEAAAEEAAAARAGSTVESAAFTPQDPRTLVCLLASPENNVAGAACDALYKFAEAAPEKRAELRTIGAIPPLSDILERLNPNDDESAQPVVQNATLCLATLAQDEESRQDMLAGPTLERLVNLLPGAEVEDPNEDDGGKKDDKKGKKDDKKDKKDKKGGKKDKDGGDELGEGGLLAIDTAESTPAVEMQWRAAAALANASLTEEARESIHRLGGTTRLLTVLSQPSAHILLLSHTMHALANLAITIGATPDAWNSLLRPMEAPYGRMSIPPVVFPHLVYPRLVS